MRGLAAVLTVALVFASTALFVGTAHAQAASGSLAGSICLESPYGPVPASDGNASVGCNYFQGLPGAVITLSRAGTLPSPAPAPLGPAVHEAESDANGYYSMSGLATGDYSFQVVRQGFKTASGTVNVAAGSVRDVVLAGEVVDAKGSVTGPDGAIAGAQVTLCCDEDGVHSGTSASDGRYSVAVTAGYWSIDVQASGFQSSSQHLLVDGTPLDVKLEKIPPQDARIAGTVRDQDGQPVPDARVSLYSYGGGCCYAYDSYSTRSSAPYYYSGENVTFTDAQGRFSMGAYAGENSLTISKDGYAYRNQYLSVSSGQTQSVDIDLMKYPEKTARLVGQVVDAKTGKGIPHAYVSVQSPEFGLYECSQPAGTGGGSSGSSGTAEAKPLLVASDGASYAESSSYYDPGCAIAIEGDGSFSGLVTPGYAIVSVYVDHYASCVESGGSDGSFSRECGPEYYSWSRSVVLPADGETPLDIRLRSRPAPDAEVSGYIVDAETGQAIPGAQVSFSNQDTYGWGYATTDADGSYRLRLRSGYHSVSVWAEGHLRWEGVVDVAKGDTPFDVTIQPGQESYGGGGCCYRPYGGYDMAVSESKAAGAPSSMGMTATSSGLSQDADGEQYEDLGGGLGPYDARSREKLIEGGSNGSPGLGLLALLAAIGAVLVLRRRSA